MDKNAFERKYNTIGVNIFRTHQLFCQDVLNLHPGEIGIVGNGKVSRKNNHSLFPVMFWCRSLKHFSPATRWYNTCREHGAHMLDTPDRFSISKMGSEVFALWHSTCYSSLLPLMRTLNAGKEERSHGDNFYFVQK